jgi:hypothetical protein
VSPLNLVDWNRRNRTFDVIAGYVPNVGGMVMTGADGLAENVSRQWVTAGFFDVLGVRPVVGRTFLPQEDARRERVVVLSEAFWRARFDGDPSVVGRPLRLDGDPFTVVGVVPSSFQLLGGTDMWAMRSISGAPPAAHRVLPPGHRTAEARGRARRRQRRSRGRSWSASCSACTGVEGVACLAPVGVRVRQPHLDRARRQDALAPGRGRDRRGGAPAVRRGPAPADAAGAAERRPRLSRRGGAVDVVDPIGSEYPTPAALLRFFDDVEREVMAVPGVSRTAWATAVPLGTAPPERTFVEVADRPPPDDSDRPVADIDIVSPSYFETLGIPIVTGRSFNRHDTDGTGPVCIVSAAFVRKHLQGRSPIGVRVALRSAESADQVSGSLDQTDDHIHVYVPLAQYPVDDIYMLVGTTSGPPEALTPAIRAAIGRVDVKQLVSVREVATLVGVAREATARHRFRAVLVMTFASLALLLAMVGVFGILAYSVQQQVRELGVVGQEVELVVG